MSHCPQCQSAIASDAVTCPHCHFILKAHGHPGIPLHRSDGNTYLCQSCTYHVDDTCDFPKRPTAQDCTLYHNQAEPLVAKPQVPLRGRSHSWRSWIQQNPILLLLFVLVIISFLLWVIR